MKIILPNKIATTTLGTEIFCSRNISDIRQQLERKAITCALIGGSSPLLLPTPIELKNEKLRNVYYLVRLTKDPLRLLTLMGEPGDIVKHCYMDGIPPIISESPTPIWGEDDSQLLDNIAEIEALEAKAKKGGILL
jgi:hypothetical protein